MPFTDKSFLAYTFLSRDDIQLLIVACTATAIASLTPTCLTILLGRVIDVLSEFSEGKYTASMFLHLLKVRCFSIAALGAVSAIFTWITVTLWMRLGERQQLRARKMLYDSLLERPVAWFENNRELNGDIIQVNRCVEEIRAGASECTGLILQALFSIIALVVTAFHASWSLTLVTMASTPLICGVAIFFSKKVEKATDAENLETGFATKIIDWNLTHPLLIKMFNSQSIELAKFSRAVSACKQAYLKLVLASSLNVAVLKTLVLLMFVQGFWFGSHQVRHNKLESGQVLTCFMSCLIIAQTFGGICEYLVTLQKANAAACKVMRFIGIEDHPAMSQISLCPPAPSGQVRFSDVSFSYPSRPDTKALTNVSLTFPAGETTFVVGKSGSGKSTLSSLLLKLYPRKEGRIEVDGFSIEDLSEKWLTENITVVQQFSHLFNDSIRNNVALGLAYKNDGTFSPEQVSDSLVNDALQKALFREDSSTKVGSKGAGLSGGQQQRVALARAIIRDTPILILDESFSALDIVLKSRLTDGLRKWRAGKTTIIMTHDYSQINATDLVYVMKDGKLLERGKKTDLKSISHQNVVANRPASEKKDRTSLYYKPLSISESDIDLEAQRPDKLLGLVEIFKHMAPYMRKRTFIVLGILCAVSNGALSPVFSFCFAKLLSAIVPPDDYIGSSGYLAKWGCIIISVVLLDGITTFLKLYLLHSAAEDWVLTVRRMVFKNITLQKAEWYSREVNTSAEIGALLMNDARDMRSLVSELLDVLSSVVVLLLLGMVWALVCGWKLALVGISMIPLFFVITALYSGLLQSAENLYKTSIAELETHVHESISGFTTIKCFQLQAYFKSCFLHRASNISRLASSRALWTGFGVSVSNVVTYASQSILLYYGLRLVGKGEYNSGQMMEIFTLLVFTLATASDLLTRIPDISRAQRAATYLVGLMKLEPCELEQRGDKRTDISGDEKSPLIRFQNISFSYDQSFALRHVSLDIFQNETIALVGESGSGKSTLVSLLLRLYAADHGSVIMGGCDIMDLSVDWIRQNVSVVPQHVSFFEGSIRDNLMYGIKNPVSDSDIQQALAMANIDHFVHSLPDGLNTKVGTGSTALISGGQSQRISIARALLRHPRILILDECTSALDPENTQAIANLVSRNFMPDPSLTTILITHDESMMRIPGLKIACLESGGIAELGSYDELLKRQGIFRRLIEGG